MRSAGLCQTGAGLPPFSSRSTRHPIQSLSPGVVVMSVHFYVEAQRLKDLAELLLGHPVAGVVVDLAREHPFLCFAIRVPGDLEPSTGRDPCFPERKTEAAEV